MFKDIFLRPISLCTIWQSLVDSRSVTTVIAKDGKEAECKVK